MKYKVNVVKRITFLLITMALAVAMVACEGVAGKPGAPGQPGQPGEPGQPGAPGEPGGTPPSIDDPIPDLQLAASGEAATRTIDLNDHFFDPDGAEGEALTFTATSNNTEAVTAEVSGSTLTLTAVAVGTARITVRATDVDGLTSGGDRFNVTVAVTVAPMVTPIPDMTLYQDDGAKTVTLSEHFSHENTITYRVVSALPAGHVMAEIAEGTLTLTPLAKGQAIVVVEATADDKSVTDNFRVDVESGSKPPPTPPPPPPPTVPPTLTAAIDDMMLYRDDGAVTIDLSGHFAHADEITYTATVRGSSVDAEASGSTLTVTPVLPGISIVTVTAAVGDKSSPHSFEVNVKLGSKPAPPAPVQPTKTAAIGTQTLYVADGAKTINLGNHFSHAKAITYTATAGTPGKVSLVVAGANLTITPLVQGSTIVTVTATADGPSATSNFTVQVMAGSKPTAPPPDPIARQGTVSAQTVKVDETKTVDVSGNFTITAGVNYAVTAANANAMATVSASGMVSITGKQVGSVDLTVTATDARGNKAMQTIAVMVTAKGAEHKPSTVMIDGVDKMREVSIDAGQRLVSLNTSIVRVSEKSGDGNVWVLTGVKKGSTEVRIWNADQTYYGAIKVTVGNTRPTMKTDPGLVIATSTGAGGDDGVNRHVTINDKGVFARAGTVADGMHAPTMDGSKNRLYHLAKVDFSKYFDDKDGFAGDIDKDGFKATTTHPDVKVVGNPTAMGVAIDVIRKTTSFPLEIYVVDKSGAMSEKATVTVAVGMNGTGTVAGEPLPDVYEVTQSRGDGDFSTAEVWLREGVNHTLFFKKTGTQNEGFRFIREFEANELEGSVLAGSPVAQDALILLPDPRPSLPSNSDEVSLDPAAYIAVTKTGKVELADLTTTDTDTLNKGLEIPAAAEADTARPSLKFSVTGSGSATVKFTYHRIVGKDGDDADTTVDNDESQWKTDYENLTININP